MGGGSPLETTIVASAYGCWALAGAAACLSVRLARPGVTAFCQNQTTALEMHGCLAVPSAAAYLSVKPARPHEGIVQNVSSVGSSNDNDACIALKAVHLRQQLVQCLLTLIVATANTSSTGSTHSINLINKDNAWCILLCLQRMTKIVRQAQCLIYMVQKQMW